jgi:hypothetical protein
MFCKPSVCSLEIISQISQPTSSVFSFTKNQPAVLSASQISPSEQAACFPTNTTYHQLGFRQHPDREHLHRQH